MLSSSIDSDGVHNSADSLHGVSAAVRRAKQVSVSDAEPALTPMHMLITLISRCRIQTCQCPHHHPALQELMFFASVGDLKRCTILARTAKQLYGADITDCQDWDARRPL